MTSVIGHYLMVLWLWVRKRKTRNDNKASIRVNFLLLSIRWKWCLPRVDTFSQYRPKSKLEDLFHWDRRRFWGTKRWFSCTKIALSSRICSVVKMFTNDSRQLERTGKYGTPRKQYLQVVFVIMPWFGMMLWNVVRLAIYEFEHLTVSIHFSWH